MIKISIVSDADIFQTQGVNYVTNTFLLGKDILKERNFELYRLYDPSKFVDCNTTECLPQFCEKKVVPSNNKTSLFKKFVKRITTNILPLELIKYFLITYKRSKRALDFFFDNDNGISDIVIFQGYLSAYMAFRYHAKEIYFKSICIMHTGCDALDQMPYSYPAIAKSKYVMEKMKGMVKKSLDSVNHLVVLSKIAKESFDYVPNEKKSIVYNGIQEKPAIKKVPPLNDKIQFVCVASLQERKGQHLLIESLSKLPNDYLDKIVLNLVGSGDIEYYRGLTVKFNVTDNVVFWGNRSDVPSVLSSMDIFILSSYGEGLPISIIEAMREGLYIMTSAVGGCPDMINEHMGCIIPLEPQGIANKMVEIIDSNIYKNCFEDSVSRFEQFFTRKVMLNRYSDIFDKIG